MEPHIRRLVEKLQLLPHPEGGYYRETYRSGLEWHPPGFPGVRSASTAIYFLLLSESFSAFHRIRSDEMWHHYEGDPVRIHILDTSTGYRYLDLACVANGLLPQALVPAGCWFASECHGPRGYALTGCTVAPGFDFADFEMAQRDRLAADFPRQRALIQRLTRD